MSDTKLSLEAYIREEHPDVLRTYKYYASNRVPMIGETVVSIRGGFGNLRGGMEMVVEAIEGNTIILNHPEGRGGIPWHSLCNIDEPWYEAIYIKE